MKRKRDTDIAPSDTPSRRSGLKNPSSSIPNTPSKSTTTPRKVKFLPTEDDINDVDEETPKANGGRTPRTPRHKLLNEDGVSGGPSPIIRNANRSARRKSVRNLIQKSIREDMGDEDAFEDEDDDLAMRIYGDDEGGDDAGSSESGSEQDGVPMEGEGGGGKKATKPTGKKRGRKKREKSPPSAPMILEGYNGYFEQNRVRARASTTATSLPEMDPKTYFQIMNNYTDKHAEDMEHLSSLHKSNFDQWAFELSQGFNVLLYGYGSKQKLLMEFAKREATAGDDKHLVIVNGYVAGLAVKDILHTVLNAVLGQNHDIKLGSNVNEMVESVLHILDTERERSGRSVTIILHSIDASALRTPQIQAVIAQLSSHPSIRLIASSDNILAPLLWDSSTLTLFNFVFHDATTFVPYDLELAAADELESIVNVLAGGIASRAGRSGAKGVKYVLASLTGNAKNLYRVLIATQLQSMEDDGAAKERVGSETYGVEYRSLYQNALEEFICSSDIVFRTLLKEFYDHQMITSRKDLQGSELLWAPFRKEELESILEDLVL